MSETLIRLDWIRKQRCKTSWSAVRQRQIRVDCFTTLERMAGGNSACANTATPHLRIDWKKKQLGKTTRSAVQQRQIRFDLSTTVERAVVGESACAKAVTPEPPKSRLGALRTHTHTRTHTENEKKLG